MRLMCHAAAPVHSPASTLFTESTEYDTLGVAVLKEVTLTTHHRLLPAWCP